MATQKKPSILDTIAARRRLDVLRARQRAPEAALKDLAAATAPPLDLYAHVLRAAGERGVALAAEFKRCSPSKGDIAVGIDAGEQALRYQAGGASVVSVLTEPTWFKGSLEDLQRVRRALESAAAADAAAETAGEKREEPGPRPNTRAAVLRKDFIVDAYQLLEARAHGADTTLLIVAILSDALLAELVAAARALGMEPLVEVNSVAELSRALAAGAEVIGVNNRNLHTFRVDLGTTERVANKLREHNRTVAATAEARARQKHAGTAGEDGPSRRAARPPIVMALSGITSRADVERYESCGVRGVLIGEALMRAPDPAQMVRELLGLPSSAPGGTTTSFSSLPSSGATAAAVSPSATSPPARVKICGIRDAASALVAARAGADFIGLIFAPKSKRRVTSARAREIVSALRAFREQEDDLGPSPVQWRGPAYDHENGGASSTASEDGAGAWFRAWAVELGTK